MSARCTLRLRRCAFVLLAGFALWHGGSGLYIHAKALLAQVLLERAWTRTLAGEERVRPWAWADTWPVARLVLPRQETALIVLAGASGRNLAFGPAHLGATALPGSGGNAVIAGHRDTHFAALEDLVRGDVLELETVAGRVRYRITELSVVDAHDGRVVQDEGLPRLTLVTCYPFHAIRPNTTQRFVVSAARAEPVAGLRPGPA